MATPVTVPRLGSDMRSGVLIRFLVAQGYQVRRGDPIYELDTDKVTQEVEAEAEGVLLRIDAADGAEVEVGATLAWIGEPGEDPPFFGLNVHRFGSSDGPPVLALHGVTGHGARFQRLAAEGLPELRWIAPDLRGHGRSDWNPPWSVEQLVTDAIEVLDAEGLGRVTVIGHSYGGLLATHLAARDPQRVERLVLLDPSIGRDPAEMLEAAEGDPPRRGLGLRRDSACRAHVRIPRPRPRRGGSRRRGGAGAR